MKNKKSKGLLITFEGCEGAGKTTQTKLLEEQLVKAGCEVVVLREPGNTKISEQIREVVLSPNNKEMAFTTEVFLFQAARAQIYQQIVLPSLKAGKVVVMDRSRDSSVVYQGMVRGFGKDLIEQLNNISTNNTYPDITFLLDLDAKVGLQRRADSGKLDRLDMENLSFHKNVRKAYFKLADEENHRWQIIDGAQSIDEIKDLIWQKVITKLKLN